MIDCVNCGSAGHSAGYKCECACHSVADVLPDRYDEQAEALFSHKDGKPTWPVPSAIAAAIRTAVSQALEDAAQVLNAEVTNEERYGMAQAAFSDAEDMVRAMKPAAASSGLRDEP